MLFPLSEAKRNSDRRLLCYAMAAYYCVRLSTKKINQGCGQSLWQTGQVNALQTGTFGLQGGISEW